MPIVENTNPIPQRRVNENCVSDCERFIVRNVAEQLQRGLALTGFDPRHAHSLVRLLPNQINATIANFTADSSSPRALLFRNWMKPHRGIRTPSRSIDSVPLTLVGTEAYI